jgi:hypothetical protein
MIIENIDLKHGPPFLNDVPPPITARQIEIKTGILYNVVYLRDRWQVVVKSPSPWKFPWGS